MITKFTHKPLARAHLKPAVLQTKTIRHEWGADQYAENADRYLFCKKFTGKGIIREKVREKREKVTEGLFFNPSVTFYSYGKEKSMH